MARLLPSTFGTRKVTMLKSGVRICIVFPLSQPNPAFLILFCFLHVIVEYVQKYAREEPEDETKADMDNDDDDDEMSSVASFDDEDEGMDDV